MSLDLIKIHIRENKGKFLKIAATSVMILMALVIFLSNQLTSAKNNDINIVETGEVALGAEDVNAYGVPSELPKPPEKELFIIVDIEGAVNNPGIVKLSEQDRVNDAVEKAGGLTDDADTMYVNLAAKLSDGDKIYIPRKNETKTAVAGIVTDTIPAVSSSSSQTGQTGSSATETAGNSLININTATSQQLQALNGIGPATAQKIIEYRESSGGFKKTEDLMKVSGIGKKTFEKLKSKITV